MTRTDRYGRHDAVAQRPTPESPEPLEEEARRERALADAERDEHEGPGPVYSPSGVHTDHTDGTAPGSGGRPAEPDGAAHHDAPHADEADARSPEPYGHAGDDVLTSPRTGAAGDRLVAGRRTDDEGPDTSDASDTSDARDTSDTKDTSDTSEIAASPAVTGVPGTSPGLDEALESRWREIKAGFVDDPRQSMEQADTLVEEALSAFTTRREALLGTWKNGGRADTEAMRLALHEYHALLAQLTRK